MDTERFGWEESGMAASESSSAKATITCGDFGKRGSWFIFMGEGNSLLRGFGVNI